MSLKINEGSMPRHDLSHTALDDPHGNGLVRFALKYPYFIVVACMMLTIMGILSVKLLPTDLLPLGNQAAVQILTFYPGMPVRDIENDISARFERKTGQAVGVSKQESKSISGVSIVRNYFTPETELSAALAQTVSLVMSVLRKLPPGTQPPLIMPFDPMSSTPIALVAVSGEASETRLYDQARYEVRPAIQTINGATAPTVMGGAERRVVAFLDPSKLSHYNFSPLRVLEHLVDENSFIPTGDIKIGDYDLQILSNGIVEKIDDMSDIPLRGHEGVEVNIKDVGVVKDASAIQTNVVMVDGKRQVYVPVYKQPGANSISVVDQVRNAMSALEKRLENVKLSVVFDQTDFIRHAIESIEEETLIGGLLAALMVLLFLGSPRATGGILLSLPLSILCAFIGLKAFGQTINAMTLGGLALSVGVLVDNSIVVIENIIQRRADGLPPLQAAFLGASGVAMPVMASTLCTLVVLFPVVFLTGVSQVLFLALAKSVTFAMVGSYLCAMTVIPLFSAHLLGPKNPHKNDLFFVLRWAQTFMEKLTAVYGSMLTRALRWRYVLIVAAIAFMALGAFLSKRIGTELFPRADAGNLVFKIRLASGIRIEKATAFSEEIDKKIHKWIPPHDLAMVIANVGLYYGFPAAYTPNSGSQDIFFNIELTKNRFFTSQHYAKIIREEFKKDYPDLDIGIELGGLLTSALNGGLVAPLDIQVEGKDYNKSHQIAQDIAQKLKPLTGATDVRVQQRIDAPQLMLKVNRRKAESLGLNTDEIVRNVVSAVSGSFSFSPAIWVDPESGIDYFLGVEVPEKEITSIDELKALPLTGHNQTRSVPLGEIADISYDKGMTEVNHVNLRRVVDVFLDAQERDIGSLSQDVKRAIVEMQLPEGYTATIRGEIKQMDEAVGSLSGGFLLAVVLVYLILVIQFRSFKLPGIIMATVPLGMVGIVLMLVITKTYFSIQAAIGAIFMIGIAVANGVLLIEFILHKMDETDSIEIAIVSAAKARLRPILMTSLASMLGLIPMALGIGHGSEANIPLGRAVIGGQLVSTTLTLFIVPVLFKILAKNKQIPQNHVEGSKI